SLHPWPQRERLWVGEAGWGRTWSRRNCRHHSTEEEEEEEEEEDDEEEEEEGLWSTAEMRRHVFARRTHTPGTGASSSLHSTPSRCHGDRGLGADTLRLRAGLFCVFPYLDVRSLLRAAEICSDWQFVARHPAVWTRLLLENARVSTKFLSTLAQWCTQTQSVVLNNLKPRSRRADESREEYHRNTRGSLEGGVEVLLRSAGGSLLHLSVSLCPHILTDRMLWLASCYCRNLQSLTYRSSSDPLCQEVLWALGAGCRNISSLQVAPTHPCQQPTRFGNRCLQTIGRCWPHLRSLSVGGAGCGTQGLAAVVRSCVHLQVLELERVSDLGLQAATELCRDGLKSLETLILTHCPVSGQAVLHFHSVCVNIRSIVVEVAVTDYFEEPDTQEAQTLFREILNTLQVLQKRPGLCDVLQVKVEGFC
uniref:F-box only protein 41-like n=1 Tax=Centroberyx gerrardi TaxID=166262 RepID=UPI003AAF961A